MPLKPLLRISPSRYSALRDCALREIRASDHQLPLLPTSPSARLGTIAHKLLQLAFSGALADEHAMQACWEEEVQIHEQEMKNNPLEKHLIPLPNYTNNYHVKQIMTYNMARPVLRENTGQAVKVKKQDTEVWVQTEDGKIGGKIDLVRHSEKGIFIVDYKTGAVLDSELSGNVVKVEYQNQLKMYAALYYLSKKLWPNGLVLVGLNQSEYNIPVDQDECLLLIKTATEYLDELNKRIEAGENIDAFAAPMPETCRFCTYRPACKKYWASRNNQLGWPADFFGTVSEKKILGNGLLRVELHNEGARITIRGLSPQRHLFLNNGCTRAMFCNLGRDIVEGCFREMPMTTGYGFS
jgi:RecB family exonuclease